MITKNFDEINESDLQSLIANAIKEGRTIEYKQALPGTSDNDKKEFLADVSSFANASGGDLIYGISENKDTGEPEQANGLDISNTDEEIRRLDSIIRDGLQPRLPFVSIRAIDLSNSKVALIMRVAKSWTSPHRVTFKGHDKFYSRSSNGKYSLDVFELRTAFTLSETLADRVRDFREERISRLIAKETPVPFYDSPKIVLHVIPATAFDPAQSVDLKALANDPRKLRPIYSSGCDYRYNIDGYLSYSGVRNQLTHSYAQFYRTGIIEAVEGLMLQNRHDGELTIPSSAYELEIIKALDIYLVLLKEMNIGLPLFVSLTLINVKGYIMSVDPSRFWKDETHAIDKDIIYLPELIVENYGIKATEIMKPAFDTLWNACGFSRSFNYDESGNWVVK